jgi:hypothetical protein
MRPAPRNNQPRRLAVPRLKDETRRRLSMIGGRPRSDRMAGSTAVTVQILLTAAGR